MFKKIRSLLAIILSLTLPTLPVLAEVTAEPISLYKQIGNEVITISEIEDAKPKAGTNEQLPWYKKVFAFNEDMRRAMFPDVKIKSLNTGEQKTLLYNSFQDPKSISDVLQTTAWADLEFYKHSNFLKTISNVRTIEGQVVLSKMLTAPSKSIEDCTLNQAIVKDLVENPRLLQALDTELKKIAMSEAFYFSLFKDQPEEITKSIELVNFLPGMKSSTSNSVQEAGALFSQTGVALGTVGVDGMLLLLGGTMLYAYSKGQLAGYIAQVNAKDENAFNSIVIAMIFMAFLAPGINLQAKNVLFSVPKYLQKRLFYAAQVINAYKRLYKLVSAHPLLRKGIIGIDNLNQLLMETSSQPKELKKLLNNLSSDTFAGEHSIFTVTGRILASSLQMTQKDIREPLMSLAEPIGCIDAYVSMAKLYKESQGTASPYCFAEFVKQDTPYLLLTNVWNPLVGKGKAIPNSVEFGRKNSRNMILTGQNTAGKSTVLKAITYSVVLAQTFGIAPAERMILTPFAIINTYVNVTDDVANGRSLFANEVFRAQGLMDRVQGLKPNEFSFTIIDEMFRGTGPEHAEVLSYKYAKKLADFPNAIVIESTHYPKLIKLEEETNGIYKNYRIDIIKKEDGSLFRPYKLENGYTLTNIAEEILKEAGLII